MAERKLPDGFSLVKSSTEAGDREYPVQFLSADSFEALIALYESRGDDAQDVLLKLWNAQNKQGATQGGKSAVRSAISTGKYKRGSGDAAVEFEGEDAIDAAIEDHQSSARGYIQAAPRGDRGPTTAKQRKTLGDRMIELMEQKGTPPTQAEMEALCKELGIDPDLL